jgi:hypothetical protein
MLNARDRRKMHTEFGWENLMEDTCTQGKNSLNTTLKKWKGIQVAQHSKDLLKVFANTTMHNGLRTKRRISRPGDELCSK